MLPARTHEISRLEAFSDAVFAFALTLLVVALDVPKSFSELMALMNGFPAFACCFALLVWIWYEHNLFFRRYGLQDNYTVVLNSILLFVVLFYVYPLKFMFDSFMDVFGFHRDGLVGMSFPQLARASAIYGLGFVVLFVMFALLYRHAYRRRIELGLTELEQFDVKMYAGHHLVSACVGLVALGVALFAPIQWSFVSPMCFGLMGPAHWLYGTRTGKERRALEVQLAGR